MYIASRESHSYSYCAISTGNGTLFAVYDVTEKEEEKLSLSEIPRVSKKEREREKFLELLTSRSRFCNLVFSYQCPIAVIRPCLTPSRRRVKVLFFSPFPRLNEGVSTLISRRRTLLRHTPYRAVNLLSVHRPYSCDDITSVRALYVCIIIIMLELDGIFRANNACDTSRTVSRPQK